MPCSEPRCRYKGAGTTKLRNVLGRLPRGPQAQTLGSCARLWKMNQKRRAWPSFADRDWLEHDYPEAAAALAGKGWRMLHLNRLDIPTLPASLSGHSKHRRQPAFWSSRSHPRFAAGVRECRRRWSAAAFLEIEKSFRKIMGYRDLWP